MAEKVELGRSGAPNSDDCRRQSEFVFEDPIQEAEWLALLELQRQLDAMNYIGDDEDEARPAGRALAGQTLDA